MEIDKNRLLRKIEEWNDVFNRKNFYIALVSVGGTALTLLDLKASTKDIDFTLPKNTDVRTFESLFKKLEIKNIGGRRFKTKGGLIFDIYYDGCIFSTILPDDFLDDCRLIKKLSNVKLYALGLNDIIISKLARNSVNDEQDIKTIFEKNEINLDKLRKRYRKIQELNLDKNIGYHFQRLMNILLREWKIRIN